MRVRWLHGAAISVAAALLSAGCSSSGEPGQCGVAGGGGAARFCSAGGDQVCVCATNRCARTDTSCPGSGLRYVYGSGECVRAGDEPTAIPSASASAVCGGADADADADAEAEVGPEGDVETDVEPDVEPDVDGGADADAEDAADAPDTEDVADVPSPEVSDIVRVGSARGQNLVGLVFGDVVLLDHIGDQNLPRETEGRDSVYFHRLGWGALSPELVAAVDAPGTQDVERAESFAVCGPGDPAEVLFAHEHGVPGMYSEPWLLKVSGPDRGTGAATVTDIASVVFRPGIDQPHSVRVAGDGGTCFVAWQQPSAVPDQEEIVVRKLPDRRGSGGWAEPKVALREDTASGLKFAATPEMGDADDFVFRADGMGGAIVVVPAKQTGSNTVLLLGQRLDGTGNRMWDGGSETGRRLIQKSSTELNLLEPLVFDPLVVRRSDATVHIAAAGVTPEAPPEYCLFYRAATLASGSGPSSPSPARPCALAHVPSLALGRDSAVFLAYWEWDQDITMGGTSEVFLLRADDRSLEPWRPRARGGMPYVVADDGGGAWLTWIFGTLTAVGIRAQRITPDLTVAPGWPPEGLEVKPADVGIGMEFDSYTAFPILAPDGGALYGWTTEDSETGEHNVYVRRVFAAP